MFELTPQERRVLIALGAFALLGLGVLAYRNYFARPNFKIIPAPLEPSLAGCEIPEKARRAVDINTADISALETLPGVGHKLAQAIADYRGAHGRRFVFKEDLMKVRGIGQKKFDGMKEYISVD